MSPIIYREYDIRGTYGSELTHQAALEIGQGFGTEVIRTGGSLVCVGYDGRLSSPALRDHLIEGLLSTGCDVIDIGVGPTPLLYFASYELETDGAIMITGSHNGPDVNGFKMMLNKRPFCGKDIQRMAQEINQKNFLQGQGTLSTADVKPAYLEFLQMDYLGHYPSKNDFKVAWDPGNGAAAEIITQLIPHLPGSHILINGTIDGTFPNHHPDPTVPANMQQLIDLVKSEGCTMGIAFDGDGDRIGAVTSAGDILYGEHLLEIFAAEVLKSYPKSPIVADVKTSTRFFQKVKALGGMPVMWNTGHSLIKEKMRELESPLGGEMSGHIFFSDRYHGFDDAIYAALRLLGICSIDKLDLDTWYRGLPPQYATPEIRLDCPQKRQVMGCLQENLSKAGVPFISTDGVRFEGPNGWWLLRASNTQEIIVARAEATSQGHLKEMLMTLQGALHQAGYEAGHAFEPYIQKDN